jgi:subtilisin family serine protease
MSRRRPAITTHPRRGLRSTPFAVVALGASFAAFATAGAVVPPAAWGASRGLSMRTVPAVPTADTAPAVAGQLLVGFDPAIDPATRAGVDRQVGATVLRRMDLFGTELVSLRPGVTVDAAEQTYAASGAVRFSQPNYVRTARGMTPNDPSFTQPASPLFEQQWGLRNTGQEIDVPGLRPFTGTPGADVHATEPGSTPDAWEVTAGSPSVLVAVLDGGIQIEHPDLVGNIWTNPREIPGNGIDDDHNHYVDDVHGWDVADNDAYVSSADPSPGNHADKCSAPDPGNSLPAYDDHGTHVAGILGAVGDNGIGIAGVAWKVKVLPVKFLSCDQGDDASAVAAIQYAIQMGARVINASWGRAGTGGRVPGALRNAIETADQMGITFVVASGNAGPGINLTAHPDYPASFDLPNEIVVASTDGNDRLSLFSNYGGPTALAAPGERIVSTLSNGGYGYMDGTSMATPFVSGAAALLLSQHPSMTPEQVKATLMATVDKVPDLASPVTRSGGRLNIAAALRAAQAGPGAAVAGPGGAGPVVQVPGATSYRLVAADGGIFTFGDAAFKGSAGNVKLNRAIVAMAATPSGQGYWMAASDGGIFAFGDAAFKGSTGDVKLAKPIVGMARTPSGQGYWLVASDGGIFAFGDAAFEGSTGSIPLNRPIVAMAPTPSGQGYWLVASDGGIFAFGDASFKGSAGNVRLTRPVAGMTATPSGQGYWLVASDGGLFAYGDASFFGSTGSVRLSQPVVAMAATLSGRGYWLVASDGGIFAFGDAPFRGSTGALHLRQPIVGMTPGA